MRLGGAVHTTPVLATPAYHSAESFGVFVQEDIARWAKVIKEANVKAEQ